MGLVRHIPLKYRLPLIHGVLGTMAKWRSRRWQKAGTIDTIRPGALVVSAFFNESLGIGRAGRLSHDAFVAAGFKTVSHDLRPAFRHWFRGDATLPESGGVWYIHANGPEVLVALLAHAPSQWADRYRIACWAWETPVAPQSWVFVAEYLHEIWVPSQFVYDAVAQAFSRAGREDLRDKLRLVPHPVPHTSTPVKAFNILRTEKRVEVLSLFDTKSSAMRKNPWAVLDAWMMAFPTATTQAHLTLKVSDLASDPATAARLATCLSGRTDISLMQERLSDSCMAAFVARFDILMSLHRSEGFGLTLTEAMAAGVAVIATGWSGNVDFMTEANSVPVLCHLIPVEDPDGAYGIVPMDAAQLWAEPDVEAAAKALRRLCDDGQLRAKLGEQAIKDVATLNLHWGREALSELPFNDHLA